MPSMALYFFICYILFAGYGKEPLLLASGLILPNAIP